MHLRSRLGGMLFGVAAAVLWLAFAPSPARAADAVVTDCSSDADLRAKLTAMQGDGGGVLTFACAEPADPNVIVLTGGVLPTIVTATTVDGDGVIVLSGGNATRHFVVGAAGSLTLKRIEIIKGLAPDDGGAIHSTGSLTILDSRLRENESSGGSGGAIVAYGPTTIANTEFAFNKAVNGGALYPRWQSVVDISAGSSFHDNEATGSGGLGGALLVWDGAQVNVADSTFDFNKAGYSGGAIYVTVASALTLTAGTLLLNDAVRFNGTALANDGRARVARSFLFDNFSSQNEGNVAAIYNTGDLTLVNSTVAEHRTGLYSAGDADVSFTTITGSAGLGLWVGLGSMIRVKNSILAVGSGPNCFGTGVGTIQSQGFNIENGNSCNLGATGDQPNTDPLFAAFGSWGGPTSTYFLQEGSPALDNGQCVAGVATDQRGFARPGGANCDVGAVEVQYYPLTVQLTGDGWVTSDPAIVDCGDFCTADVFERTTVALSATADEGFTFTGWNSQACAGAGTGVCNVIMVRPAAVFPTFVEAGRQIWLPVVEK